MTNNTTEPEVEQDDLLADVIRKFGPHFARYMEEHGTEGRTE